MDRGQAHTLEAFTAALLLVSGVVFALQATAVTPLSASTSNQHIENQQRLVANDVLGATAENGSLREAVLFWSPSTNRFPGAGERGYYTNGGPPNEFGETLNRTFRERRIAFNVHLTYQRPGTPGRKTMVYMGSPTDNAVTATRLVPLYNDSELTAPGATQTLGGADANGSFYAPDVADGSTLFNVVEVEIVVWRM